MESWFRKERMKINIIKVSGGEDDKILENMGN